MIYSFFHTPNFIPEATEVHLFPTGEPHPCTIVSTTGHKTTIDIPSLQDDGTHCFRYQGLVLTTQSHVTIDSKTFDDTTFNKPRIDTSVEPLSFKEFNA